MKAFEKRNCIALAAVALLAAACATDNAGVDTPAAPASAAGNWTGAQSAAARPQARADGGALGPKTAGAQPVAVKGLPAQRTVYFDLDQFDIKPEFLPVIEAHARYLRTNSGAKLTIEGNGDERGSREYNLALGQRRAEAVRRLMRLSGAADAQIETVSYGEEKPRAHGHDEASWAQNRRSDIVYQRGE